MELRPLEIVIDGWRVYVDRDNQTVAVSSPERPAEIPVTATRCYVSPADYEAMKIDVLRPATKI
jgi:hypothetical protein